MKFRNIFFSSKMKKYLLFFGFALLGIFLFLKYIIGFHQIDFHLRELTSYFSQNKNHNPVIEAEIITGNPANTISDTIAAVGIAEDLHPLDTNILVPESEYRNRTIQIIKNAHFEKLKIAQNPPSDEQAQIALAHFTNGRLTNVIINQKLNIKIGKCYKNLDEDVYFRCVSCMILLYNRERKDWQEAPDGENFLRNAYDFYQVSEGDFWEAKDLSMRIPYDYPLFKKYTKEK